MALARKMDLVPFAPMDTLFASLRRPMLIITRLTFDTLPDRGRLCEELKGIVSKFPRFSCIVRSEGGNLFWQRISPERLDWGYHVQHRSGTLDINEIEREALDPAHPRWKIVLTSAGSHPVVFAIFDHVMGDGVSVSEVLFSLSNPGSPQGFLPPRRRPPSDRLAPLRFLLDKRAAVSWLASNDAGNALRPTTAMGRAEVHCFSESPALLSLQDVKACKLLANVTVNEVVIAAAALAARKALRRKGDQAAMIQLAVGANMRRGRFWDAPKKHFGNQALNYFFPVELAPGFDSGPNVCVDMLAQVSYKLRRVSTSRVMHFLYNVVIPFFPGMTRQAVKSMDDPGNDKATLWVAPVVGPEEVGALGGQTLRGIDAFVSAEDVPLYCGAVSYGGHIRLSFGGDPRLLNAAAMRLLVEDVCTEFQELKRALEAGSVVPPPLEPTAEARELLADPQSRFALVVALATATALSGPLAILGLLLGGVLGFLLGLLLAVFTFGLSVPICAALGAGAGLAVAVAGGTLLGLTGGALGGCALYARRSALRQRADSAWAAVKGLGRSSPRGSMARLMGA